VHPIGGFSPREGHRKPPIGRHPWTLAQLARLHSEHAEALQVASRASRLGLCRRQRYRRAPRRRDQEAQESPGSLPGLWVTGCTTFTPFPIPSCARRN